MDQKIEKQGRAVTQLREKYDNEFGKLVALKQERLKLQQELSAPDVNSSELFFSPAAAHSGDENLKAELNALLTQELALQETRKQMALNFATNATLVRQCAATRTNLDDDDDMDLTEKPPEELEQPSKAPKNWWRRQDRRSIMTEADQQITNLTMAAGAAVQK